MSISWPTKEQWRAAILALYKAERPDADSTKYSDLWLNSRIWSVIAYRLGKTVQQLANAVMPGTSFESYLDTLLSLYGLPDGQGNFGRILPHISAASDGIRATADAGGAGIAAGALFGPPALELTDSAGNIYVIASNNAFIAAGASEDLDIESVTTGYTVNLESGTTLTWVTPAAGSDPTADLVKDLTGGKDLGEDDAENSRLLTRVRYPGLSGNVGSWTQTIEAVSPGNLKAYVWPQRQNQPYGYGLTDYAAQYTNENGTDRFITVGDDMQVAITAAVDAALPALIYRNSRWLIRADVPVDCDMTIEVGSGATEEQKCDWDAEGNKTVVNANDAGGPNITASANVCSPTITNGLEVGHKVVIYGVEGTVTAVNVGANPAIFAVADWPDGWGTALNSITTYNVTSGGGFIGYKTEYENDVEGTGCVGAVHEYIDTRGPNVLENAAQSQIPGWESSILIKRLESACFVAGEGVIEVADVDDLNGAPAPPGIAHASEDGATVSTYYADEVTIWQVFV